VAKDEERADVEGDRNIVNEAVLMCVRCEEMSDGGVKPYDW